LVLFIFESIGTQELILIGIVALIFLGPRRMPEMARKLGKMMSDFRNTTSEFKATWEREVNFDEEERALRTGDIESKPVSRAEAVGDPGDTPPTPEVRAIDAEEVRSMLPEPETSHLQETTKQTEENAEKRDWL
jgi:sec-independent protein translocase protein TatB